MRTVLLAIAAMSLAACGRGPSDADIAEAMRNRNAQTLEEIRSARHPAAIMSPSIDFALSLYPTEEAVFAVAGSECSARDDRYVCSFDLAVTDRGQTRGPDRQMANIYKVGGKWMADER